MPQQPTSPHTLMLKSSSNNKTRYRKDLKVTNNFTTVSEDLNVLCKLDLIMKSDDIEHTRSFYAIDDHRLISVWNIDNHNLFRSMT